MTHRQTQATVKSFQLYKTCHVYLEEAMGAVPLSQPESCVIRYVHERDLHHPLIDPTKTERQKQVKTTQQEMITANH